MHVAILGAGALGRVYGARLAKAGAAVTFVVRKEHVGSLAPIRIARIDGDRTQHVLEAPERAAAVPPSADVVLVCVRVEQVSAAAALLEATSAPVVVLTPLLPHDLEGLVARLGPRVFAAMPGVVAYITPDGTTRYWLPKVAPTLVDEPRPPLAAVSELVRCLEASGLPARFELGVHEMDPATTVAFLPLMMGLDAAGSIDALLRDRPLLALSVAAAREGQALSKRIGRSATWAGLLTRFVGPRLLRVGVGLARRQSPEAVHYVEEHFGRKLHAQNVAMAKSMIDLAREKGTPCSSLEKLHARLVARA